MEVKPKVAKRGKVIRKKGTFKLERSKKTGKTGKSRERQEDAADAEKHKWSDLACTSVFNSQTESIIIDQVKCQMPGNQRWEGDDVIDLDGLESDVDELKLSDYLSDSALNESKTVKVAVTVAPRSPSHSASSDIYNLRIPKSVQTKTITDEHSTEEDNNSAYRTKNVGPC